MRLAWLLPSFLVLLSGVAAAQVSPKHGPLSRLDGALQQAHAAHATGEAVRVASGHVALGHVAVDVTATDGDGADLLRRLDALGLQDGVAVGPVVSGRFPVASLDRLAALDGVRAARAVQGVTHSRRAGRDHPAHAPVLVGAVTGEAARAMRIEATRDALGLSGEGIRMGMLSDSYNVCARLEADGDDDNDCVSTAADDIASGDLPDGGALVLRELPAPTGSDAERGTDEGRAMMQLAYDVAPAVSFSFYTAFLGQAAFAQGIRDLADDSRGLGADVVVDDVLLFAEPFFQDGLVAQAVEDVVSQGVVYASSAGNQADQAYESDFVDSNLNARFRIEDDPTTFLEGDLHDFDPSPDTRDAFQDITLDPDESITIVFQYAEPSFSATGDRDRATTSDYDIYIVGNDTRTATILTGSASNNNINPVMLDDGSTVTGSGEPVEVLSYTNEGSATETVYLAIVLFSGEPRFMKYIDFDGQGTFQFAQSRNSTSVAHNNAAAALNVGAAAWFNTPAFNSNVQEALVNSFSSYGGSRVFFDADGNPVDEDRRKPDVVGSDGDNNTFFGFETNADSDSNPNFFGTSAAAPNVGALAALMLEAAGGAGALEPSEVYSILEDTADDIRRADSRNVDTNAGYDVRSGFGFVRGDRALQAAADAGGPVSALPGPVPAAFAIRDLGPNPARSALALTVVHDLGGDLAVGLYDVLGRRVAVLHDGRVGPGEAVTLSADVSALPSGTYLVRAAVGAESVTRPVTVVR